MSKIAALVFAAALLFGAVGASAAGLSTLDFTFEVLTGTEPAGAVNLNGARLMTIRGGGWASASAAKAAAEALHAALMDGIRPEAITVEKAEGGYAINAGTRRVLLVDGAMASAMKSSRDGLAEEWAKGIRQALAGPYITVPVDSQIVPFGERRVIPVQGKWEKLSVSAEGQTVRAELDAVANTLALMGLAVGEVQVILDAGGPKLVLPVRVMKYAGRVAAAVDAVVTGRITPEWVIKRAASAAVYYSVEPEPGAWAEISGILSNAPQLTPGGLATVTMQVTVQGEGYLPLRATPEVRVVNQAIPTAPAEVLMVSNRPERLPSYGQWYAGRVPTGHPARLLYHHVNAAGRDGELAVELTNVSDHPVQVQIVEASGGPSRDELFVGHKAARDFLRRQADDVGYVVAIPGGCTYTAIAQGVKPSHVISGLVEVRVIGEGELRVAVRLRPPSSDIVTPVAATPPDRLSTWVFTEPHKEIKASYRVGSHWAFATIGDKQVLSSTGRELLDGDYGVFYDITFDVENPTDQPGHVELALMPGGGLARGIVMIDGHIHETGLLRYGQTERVFSFTVPASGRREVRVRTMPQAGSNYPVKLVMRPKGVWD
ncbi:MAG: hypothetical protein JSV65_06425 [Armatimonadota bacterium]|nr:MAG: hypothetical protein JSV65_06425 [Armatimonadota bacterium]